MNDHLFFIHSQLAIVAMRTKLMMMVVKSTSVCLRGPVLMLLCISTGGHCTDDKVVLERNKFFYPMMIICHHDSFFTGQFISMNK